MVFASLEFLLLFLPVFLLVYSFTPARFKNFILLIFSWAFYAWWSVAFLLLFIAISLWTWLIGIAIEKSTGLRLKKYSLILLIVVNAATLFWFKYINIFIATLNELLGWHSNIKISWEAVILPIGLSFIILQAISYGIDIYRGLVPAQRNFFEFATYLSMFTQLIAGPIIRYDWVQKELTSRHFCFDDFVVGTRRFMIGLSMKVLIADSLAPIVDTAFTLSNPSLMDAWLGAIGYTFQLFFDFAGYSAMAIGLGRMLGFHFPENFNHPYLAVDIQDFWRRWHISLSSWIRDYLYIPLGGNRQGAIRTYVNLLITMAIAGMWHGGNSWNFLFWGLGHGAALSLNRFWSKHASFRIPSLLSRTATLLFVVLAWVIFRATSLEEALIIYAGQFGLSDIAISEPMRLVLRNSDYVVFILALLAITAPFWTVRYHFFSRSSIVYLFALWPFIGFLLALMLLSSREVVPFLYFQF